MTHNSSPTGIASRLGPLGLKSVARCVTAINAPIVRVMHWSAVCGLAAVVLFGLAGCVRRTLTIRTHPTDALVFLNDEEIGRSDVTTDFLWYGDYDIVIRKPGYETLATNWEITPPWYEVLPIDFFAEVFWPGMLHDQRERQFTLQPQQIPTQDELVQRALKTRDRALDTRR